MLRYDFPPRVGKRQNRNDAAGRLEKKIPRMNGIIQGLRGEAFQLAFFVLAAGAVFVRVACTVGVLGVKSRIGPINSVHKVRITTQRNSIITESFAVKGGSGFRFVWMLRNHHASVWLTARI
jgi:hypothetical protein